MEQLQGFAKKSDDGQRHEAGRRAGCENAPGGATVSGQKNQADDEIAGDKHPAHTHSVLTEQRRNTGHPVGPLHTGQPSCCTRECGDAIVLDTLERDNADPLVALLPKPQRSQWFGHWTS